MHCTRGKMLVKMQKVKKITEIYILYIRWNMSRKMVYIEIISKLKSGRYMPPSF